MKTISALGVLIFCVLFVIFLIKTIVFAVKKKPVKNPLILMGVSFGLVVVFGMLMPTDPNAAKTPSPEPPTSQVSAAEKQPEKDVSDTVPPAVVDPDDLTMPVIAGTNAYDTTVAMENNGMPKATRIKNDDGTYSFFAGDSNYNYEIETDENYQIGIIEFYCLIPYDGVLGFVASFPREDGDPNEAMDWVNEHVGEEITTTIGDATFELSVGENENPILHVKSIGFDEYVDAWLDSYLDDKNE